MPENNFRPSSRGSGGNGRAGGLPAAISDDDLFVLVVLAGLCAPGVLLAIPHWRELCLRWLVDHQLLVATSAHPIWTLPGDIAGLDGRRVVVLGLLAAAAIAGISSWAWHRYQRWMQQRLTAGDQL